jgi:hypothetical protein
MRKRGDNDSTGIAPPIEHPPTFACWIYCPAERLCLWRKSLARLFIFVPRCSQRLRPRCRLHGTEVHLASWRQSADASLNQNRSKVIDGRFDGTEFIPALLGKIPIVAEKWSASAASLRLASALNSPEYNTG